MNEKVLRLKYIRSLERFVSRSVALLRSESFEYDLFKKKALGFYDEIQLCQSFRLDSEYYNLLIAYINLILQKLEECSEQEFMQQRDMLLKQANTLHKQKQKKSYKKAKHKNKKYSDGY